jgi:hypothetical protein
VWGKLLPANGTHPEGFALGFLNNEDSKMNVTCDSTCFSAMLSTANPTQIAVRDLWAHAEKPTLDAPFTFTAELEPNGGVAVYRFYLK